MGRIADVKIVRVGLLQELFSVGWTTTKSWSFPAIESAWSFNLVDLAALLFIVAGNHHPNAEWSHATRLSELLEQVRNRFCNHEGRDTVLVSGMVLLDVFARLEDHRTEICAKSRVCQSHVVA